MPFVIELILIRAINEVNTPSLQTRPLFHQFVWLKYTVSNINLICGKILLKSELKHLSHYCTLGLRNLVEVQQLNDQLLLILILTPRPFCSQLNKTKDR